MEVTLNEMTEIRGGTKTGFKGEENKLSCMDGV